MDKSREKYAGSIVMYCVFDGNDSVVYRDETVTGNALESKL